jgi:hypothetical protein
VFRGSPRAFWWDEARHIAIAFGNDGYNVDERARLEVEAVRRLIHELGGKELSFATGDDGYSWALACELATVDGVAFLEGMLWAAWNELSELKGKGLEVKLNLDAIKKAVESRTLPRVTGGVQVNIARAVLERNGLI